MKLSIKVVVPVPGSDNYFELAVIIYIYEGGDCVFIRAACIVWESGDHRAVEIVGVNLSVFVGVNDLHLPVTVNITERGNLHRAAGLERAERKLVREAEHESSGVFISVEERLVAESE